MYNIISFEKIMKMDCFNYSTYIGTEVHIADQAFGKRTFQETSVSHMSDKNQKNYKWMLCVEIYN